MPVLATADLHLTDNPADEYRHEFMEALVDIAARRKLDGIAILGDLTEAKDHHSAQLVNRIVGHVKALSEIAPVIVLEGNHDFKNEGHPFFAFLNQIPNIAWIGNVQTNTDLPKQFHKPFHNTLFLPHTRNYKRDWEGVNMNGRSYIYAHNTFNGASVGFGRNLDGIPVEVFPRKSVVIAGDIHVPQQLGPITYCGAPYTVDFGDEFDPRLLLLSQGGHHAISVARYPQKRLIGLDGVHKIVGTHGIHAGDILKVRVNVESMANWAEIHADVLRWAQEKEVIAQRIEPVLTNKAVRKRVKVREDSEQSDGELLTQYAKRHQVDDVTLKVGMALLGDK